MISLFMRASLALLYEPCQPAHLEMANRPRPAACIGLRNPAPDATDCRAGRVVRLPQIFRLGACDQLRFPRSSSPPALLASKLLRSPWMPKALQSLTAGRSGGSMASTEGVAMRAWLQHICALSGALAAAAAASLPAAAADPIADFYSGKTVQVLIGFSP